jgi:serine protease
VNVAATDSLDRLASFSNFGSGSVTLAAPGVGILSTTPNNTYSSFNGTSMAAPHVAGAIALFWSQNPTLTYTQVISKLTSSVDVISGLSTAVKTSGRLNVAKMLEGGTVAPAPKVTSAVFNGVANTNFSSVRVTFDRAIDAGTFTTADITAFTGPGGAAITATGVTAVSSTVFDITFAAQTTAGSYSLTFGPNVTSGGRAMDQNNNGTAGEAADTFTATGTLVLNVTRTYGLSNLTVAINDNATAVSSFTITDNVSITDLNVRVSLTHTYTSDLVITLQGPTVNGVAGPTVTLFNRRGGSGDNLTNTGFDDEATTAIANGAAPFNGTFRADGLLSAFDGRSTAGTWTLRVQDVASRDVGRITAWSITATGTIGGGGSGQAQAMGFRAEGDFDAAPASFAADAARAVETIADASAPASSALGLFGLLGLDEVPAPRDEFVTADAPAREERVVQFAAPTNDLVGDEDDFDAILAVLYMPPSEGETSTADEGALAGV